MSQALSLTVVFFRLLSSRETEAMKNKASGQSLARAFLAIRVPCDLALTLHQLTAGLSIPGLRWVAPEQLHITL